MQNLNQLFFYIIMSNSFPMYKLFFLHLTNQATSIKKKDFKNHIVKSFTTWFRILLSQYTQLRIRVLYQYLAIKFVVTLNFYCCSQEINFYNSYSADHSSRTVLKKYLLLNFNFKLVFTFFARNISLCIFVNLFLSFSFVFFGLIYFFFLHIVGWYKLKLYKITLKFFFNLQCKMYVLVWSVNFFFLHIKARSTVFVIFKKEIKPKNET